MGQKTSTEHVEHITGPMRGVDVRTLSTKLAAGYFRMLRNLDFTSDIGGFTIRKGSRRINTTSLGSSRILGMKRWYKAVLGTTPETVVAHGTQLYTMSALGVMTSIGTGFTAGSTWFFEAYDPGVSAARYLFTCNGANAPRRWDGTTLRTWGFPSTAWAGSATPGAAGNLTGQYSWAVTHGYDSLVAHESTAALGPTTTPTAQRVDLASIPLGGTGCTSRRLYRTKAGGTNYYFLATINDNTTTTYEDNIADTALGVAQAPLQNGVPPSDLKLLLIRKDRAVGISAALPNVLRLSAVTTTERSPAGGQSIHGAGVEIWPSTHRIPIGDDGAPIVALDYFRGSWIIFQHNRIWTLRGQTASDLDLDNTESVSGCAAARTVVNMGLRDGIFFLGVTEGVPRVYRFNGVSAESISDTLDDHFREFLVGYGSGVTIQPCAKRVGNVYRLVYATNKGGTTFERAEFDVRLKRWQISTIPDGATVMEVFDGPEDAGQVVYGHAQAGYVVQMDIGRGDFNYNNPAQPYSVTMEIQTGWLDGGSANSEKQLSHIDIVGEAQADAEIDISRSFNFDESADAATSVDGGPDVEGNALTMAARAGEAFHKRVDCSLGNEEGISEQGFTARLDIAVTVPAGSEGDEYRRAVLHDLRTYYVEHPPASHEHEASSDEPLDEL